MKNNSYPAESLPHKAKWIQTELKTHEAWGRLTIKNGSAAAVMHTLCAMVGEKNAVVVSQAVIAKALGITDRTVRSAIKALEDGQWIQVVRIGKGRECAYVLNDRVAWSDKRSNLHLSLFSATVVADAEDQEPQSIEGPPLHRIPTMQAGEKQLPTGEGEDPPSQPSLTGFEHDLPAKRAAKKELASRARLAGWADKRHLPKAPKKS